VKVTVKKLRKPAIVYKTDDGLQNSFGTSGPQNIRCGKCCQVLATKTLSPGFVLSQFSLCMFLSLKSVNTLSPTSVNRHSRNFSTWRGFSLIVCAAMPISWKCSLTKRWT